jgi:hypothetical protein
VAFEAEGHRFKSRGPLVFLRIFLLRNAPAGNHQLVAEDLMEDGTVSCISNAYSLRKKKTTNIGRIAIYNCNCNVKKEIKTTPLGWKTFFMYVCTVNQQL